MTRSLIKYPFFEYKAYPMTSIASVPELTTMLLLDFGLIGLAGVMRKFKK